MKLKKEKEQLEKKREENNEKWTPVLFEKVNENWIYKKINFITIGN